MLTTPNLETKLRKRPIMSMTTYGPNKVRTHWTNNTFWKPNFPTYEMASGPLRLFIQPSSWSLIAHACIVRQPFTYACSAASIRWGAVSINFSVDLWDNVPNSCTPHNLKHGFIAFWLSCFARPLANQHLPNILMHKPMNFHARTQMPCRAHYGIHMATCDIKQNRHSMGSDCR